jgi:hypothetical protein
MLALEGPLYYQSQNPNQPKRWMFDYPYTVTTPGGTVVSCLRRVVVEYQQWPGYPDPVDIVSSFYGSPVGTLP